MPEIFFAPQGLSKYCYFCLSCSLWLSSSTPQPCLWDNSLNTTSWDRLARSLDWKQCLPLFPFGISFLYSNPVSQLVTLFIYLLLLCVLAILGWMREDCVCICRFFNTVFSVPRTILGTYWVHIKYLLKKWINTFANFSLGVFFY